MNRFFTAVMLSFATCSVLAQTAPCTLRPQHVSIPTPGAPVEPYVVHVSFGDSPVVIPIEVDTGSTGIVVAADALPADTPAAAACRPDVVEYTRPR